MNSILLIQLIGAVGYSLLGISYFKKEKKQILFMQIFSYIFFSIHYYLLNGVTGVICNIIGLLALITIYLFDKYKINFKLTISTFYIFSIVIINILTYQNIYSFFPMIASVIVIISFLIYDENMIRKIGIVAAVCWLIYAIVYKSYVAIIFEVITLVDVCLSLYKNIDKKN